MTQLLGCRGEGEGKKKGWIIAVLVRTMGREGQGEGGGGPRMEKDL